MAIIINIDVMLAKRKMSVTELTEKVGITMANISILKNGKAKAIRLSTLEAICKALECQPGDILGYKCNKKVIPMGFNRRNRSKTTKARALFATLLTLTVSAAAN